MILAALDVFAKSLDFMVDQRHLLLEKTWDHIVLSAAALAPSESRSASCSVICTVARSSPSTWRTSAGHCRRWS